MVFMNPWGLAALAAVPAIVAIHLLRRRFRPRRVAGLFLWAEPDPPRPAGRRLDRLPISASLLLELLAATLLALLLADLRLGAPRQVAHLVAVLDGSASMSAVPPQSASVRDRAVSELLERVGELGRAARVTVLVTGQPPRALYGPAAEADASAVRTALKSFHPAMPRHSFEPALALAAQLAGDSGQVLFLTDHLPADASQPNQTVRWLAFGAPLANVGFVAARREADPDSGDRSRCFLHVRNFSAAAVTTDLAGWTVADKPVAVASQKLSLNGGGQWTGTIQLPAGCGTVTFKLGDDPLAIDNQVALAPETHKEVRYRNMLPAGPVAQAVDRALASIRRMRPAKPGEPAELAVRPARSSQSVAENQGTWQLFVGPLGDGATSQPDELTTDGPFVIDHADPLTADVTFDGVILGRISPAVPADMTPLISAGTRIVLGRSNSVATNWLLNCDPQPVRSTLTRSPDWVILLTNLSEMRRKAIPGLDPCNFRVGEPVHIPVPPSADRLTLKPPAGQAVRIEHSRRGPVTLDDLAEAGIYELGDDAGPWRQVWAVNWLDAGESDLSNCSSGQSAGEGAKLGVFLADESSARSPLAALLAVLAALALLADWHLLRARPHRRSGR